MEGGNLSMRAVSTIPAQDCCKPANEAERKVFWSREYHAATDKVIHTARNIIMQSWWDWNKEHHGIGIPADDESYVHPPNLHPWERKALVYINPYAGYKKSGKYFQQVESILKANGFVMDTVTTYRKNQVFEEMALMGKGTFKSYYMRLVFSGDGLLHELINGYYHRSDHSELKLRYGALPGGSGNAAAYMAAWSYNLDHSVNLISSLHAVTRLKFEPLGMCKYETNGERETIYGFHHFAMGFISDVIHLKAKNAYHGNEGYKRGIKESIAAPKVRKLNLAYLPKDAAPADANPPANTPAPESWKVSGNHCFNFLWSNFPVFAFDNEITQRLTVGDKFGQMIESNADDDNAHPDCEKCNDFKQWLEHTTIKNNTELMESKATYSLVNGWRIDMEGGDPAVTQFSIDGEIFHASSIQCTFLEENNVLQACRKRKF